MRVSLRTPSGSGPPGWPGLPINDADDDDRTVKASPPGGYARP